MAYAGAVFSNGRLAHGGAGAQARMSAAAAEGLDGEDRVARATEIADLQESVTGAAAGSGLSQAELDRFSDAVVAAGPNATPNDIARAFDNVVGAGEPTRPATAPATAAPRDLRTPAQRFRDRAVGVVRERAARDSAIVGRAIRERAARDIPIARRFIEEQATRAGTAARARAARDIPIARDAIADAARRALDRARR